MSDLSIIQDQALTMSSREIAELTDKRHDHVMRDIRTMLVELHGEGGVPKFGDTHTNPQNGQTYPVFMLPKRETLILVSGYNLAMRAKIIDRWQELEAQIAKPALPDFGNPAAAARAWADAIEQKQAIEAQAQQVTQQLALVAPKAQALDRIASSDGSLCLTDAAKTLQVQPRQFTQILQAKHWIYRRPMGSGWLAYQDRIQSGHLEHKVTTGEKSDGHEWTNTQVRVTAKGLTRLAQVLEEVFADQRKAA